MFVRAQYMHGAAQLQLAQTQGPNEKCTTMSDVIMTS